MNKSSIKFLASCGLVLTAAIWGFAFVIVKDSLDYIGPIWMMAARFSIAAAALALVFFKKLKALTWTKFFHGAVTGAFLFLVRLSNRRLRLHHRRQERFFDNPLCNLDSIFRVAGF